MEGVYPPLPVHQVMLRLVNTLFGGPATPIMNVSHYFYSLNLWFILIAHLREDKGESNSAIPSLRPR